MSDFQLHSLSSERLARGLMARYGIREGDLPFGQGKYFPTDNKKQFSSYDYLNLRMHPEVVEAAKDAIERYGMSATSSRVLSGELDCHLELEDKLASLYSQESALLFVSGHTTNTSTVSTLVERGDLIVIDQYAHNSLQIGASMSGAEIKLFKHNDVEDLSLILKNYRSSYERCLIITEGHFSMDGDIPNLPEICKQRDKFNCILMVDEAHSLGVLGENGQGIFEEKKMDPSRVDIWMGTLSKSLGSTGGFIAAKKSVIEHLRRFAPGFTFSVGINAPSCAAASCALNLIPKYKNRITKLRHNSLYLWRLLSDHGFDVGESIGSAIIPIIMPLDSAIFSSLKLLKSGWSVYPLVPPSVHPFKSRLRLFIRSDHEKDDLDCLFTELQDVIYQENA